MRLKLWGIVFLAGMISGLLLNQLLRTQYRPPQISHDRTALPDHLNTDIDLIDLQSVPLDEVIDRFNRERATNIVVRWESLENIGVNRKKPVSLHVHNLPLRRVLDLICAEADGGAGTVDYGADDGVILISTTEDLARQAVMRIYDVRKLIFSESKLFYGLSASDAEGELGSV